MIRTYNLTDYDKKVIDNSSVTKMKAMVRISNLRIRKGPGTDYAWTGKYCEKRYINIVETKPGKGWGRLENGNGWISMDYAK